MATLTMNVYPSTKKRWKKAMALLNKRADGTLNYLFDLLDAVQLDKRPK